MPYLRVETNRTLPPNEVVELQTRLTQLVSRVKGDPVAMIATVIVEGAPVSFGGCATKPAAVVTLTNATMDASKTRALTTELSDELGRSYEVPPERMYLFFHEYKDPHLVGWNGTTFDRILADTARPLPAATAAEEA